MDHVFVLYDRASNSVWYPGEDETLQAVGGERKGEAVRFLDEPAPVLLGEWLDAHPGSTVLLPTEEDARALNRAYLGVSLDVDDEGLIVRRVSDGSPAATAGLRIGDVLRKIDGRPLTDRDSLRDVLGGLSPGDRVDVVVARDGRETRLQATLGSPP